MIMRGLPRQGASSDPPETVHVVDDDAAVRDSIQFVLASAGWRISTYASASELLEQRLPLAGCVVTDFQMPGMNGLQLQDEMAKNGWRLPVIVMTGHGDIPVAVRALKAGAVDFLEKPFADDELLHAVGEALAVNRRAIEVAAAGEKARRLIGSLTPRENEVLDLLVLGQSNKEMARELGISPRTVDVHRARVFQKLYVSTLPDLVRLVLAGRPEEANGTR
jgi:FixJ family two-component response regulator